MRTKQRFRRCVNNPLERDRKCVYNDLQVNVKGDFVLRVNVRLEITGPAGTEILTDLASKNASILPPEN